MSTQEEAQKAISMFNGKDFDGRPLTVNIARPREERGGFGRDDRRGGGGYNNNRGGRKPGGNRDRSSW